MDFKVGQTVFVQLIGNRKPKRGEPNICEEWEIVKVGRKYIHARAKGSGWVIPFEYVYYGGTERWVEKTDGCKDYLLWETKEAFLEWDRADYLISELRSIFEGKKALDLTLEQLERIFKITEERKGNSDEVKMDQTT